MAFVHGKGTYLSVNGQDLSAFCNTSEFGRSADDHDVTTYGQTGHVYTGGLTDGEFSCEGIYDNTVSGPRAVLEPLIGTTVPIVRRPEGTGTGRPQQSFNALVSEYNESSPVDDMVTWTGTFMVSGTVTRTTQ